MIGVSSGTDALLLSLMALGIGPGDEVLCPSFTFFATAGSVSRTGATPVFVDSLDDDFNLDLEDAARRVTDKTKAIIPVHLFGQAADMDAVHRLASAHDLMVLEDAAQSMGTQFGEKAGMMGDLCAFSFFRPKPRRLRGRRHDYHQRRCPRWACTNPARSRRCEILVMAIGGNFRLDPLQAALLRTKLGHLPGYIAKRRANAATYLERLAESAPCGMGVWFCPRRFRAGRTRGTSSLSA